MRDADDVPANVPAVRNPFATREVATVATARSDEQRAITEVQAALVVARTNPRSEKLAWDRIVTACQRPGLAEAAVFSYARGGTDITGPSIRLAEAVAQAWGNMQFGIRELDQAGGASTVQAYAWDVETNVRREVTFVVQHERHSKKGVTALTDPRDIYETVANAGARRLRACILALIPGDVVEAAVRQCEQTLHTDVDNGPEAIVKMVSSFAAMGITTAQLEARIQRRLDTITKAQVVALRKVYVSLRDGMSAPEDWFPVERSATAQAEKQSPPPQTQVEETSSLAPPAAPAPQQPKAEEPKPKAKAKAKAKAEETPPAQRPDPAAEPEVFLPYMPANQTIADGALLWQGNEFGFVRRAGGVWYPVPEAEAEAVYNMAHVQLQRRLTKRLQELRLDRDAALLRVKEELKLAAPPAKLAQLRLDQLADLAKALGMS